MSISCKVSICSLTNAIGTSIKFLIPFFTYSYTKKKINMKYIIRFFVSALVTPKYNYQQ